MAAFGRAAVFYILAIAMSWAWWGLMISRGESGGQAPRCWGRVPRAPFVDVDVTGQEAERSSPVRIGLPALVVIDRELVTHARPPSGWLAGGFTQ